MCAGNVAPCRSPRAGNLQLGGGNVTPLRWKAHFLALKVSLLAFAAPPPLRRKCRSPCAGNQVFVFLAVKVSLLGSAASPPLLWKSHSPALKNTVRRDAVVRLPREGVSSPLRSPRAAQYGCAAESRPLRERASQRAVASYRGTSGRRYRRPAVPPSAAAPPYRRRTAVLSPQRRTTARIICVRCWRLSERPSYRCTAVPPHRCAAVPPPHRL